MYNYEENLNDIALIELDKEVELDENKRAACLPSDSLNLASLVNESLLFVGWGDVYCEATRKWMSNKRDQMKNGFLQMVDPANCSKMYPFFQNRTQFCASKYLILKFFLFISFLTLKILKFEFFSLFFLKKVDHKK